MNRRHTLLVATLLVIGLALCWASLPVRAEPPSQQREPPQLVVTKVAEGNGTIGPGQTIRFRITVTNTGTAAVSNVTIKDDYDETTMPVIEVVPSLEQMAISTIAQNDGDVIIWQVGDLAAGAVWSTSYEGTAADAIPTETGEIVNDVFVYADGLEAARATVRLTVQAPHLSLSRQRERVNGEGDIIPGDTVRYTISYVNDGLADANGVVLEESFDETVVRAVDNVTADGQRDGGTIRWELGTVPGGSRG